MSTLWQPPATVAMTGAAGKTGRAVASQLLRRGVALRLLARPGAQTEALAVATARAGEVLVVPGDLRDAASLRALVAGADAIYHICPNMAPDEEDIGVGVLAEAVAESDRRGRPLHLAYHSVLHPQTPEMPHHWRKMRVEGHLWRSGLPITLLQPAPYMQNVLAGRRRLVEEGVHAVPYTATTRIGMVDLIEVAEVAAHVLCEAGHAHATYELANGEALTQQEVVDVLAAVLRRPVRVESIAQERWRASAVAGGLDAEAADTLLKMFSYYEAYGLRGGSAVMRHLLGRAPATFDLWAGACDWLEPNAPPAGTPGTA